MFKSNAARKPRCFARAQNTALQEGFKMANGWGGRRAGAGRPRNPPVLVELPRTDCAMQWLLAAMNCPALPLPLRLDCARALLPYWHHKQPQSARKG